MRTFADALDAIPMVLAENRALQPIETLSALKAKQVKVICFTFKFCIVRNWMVYFTLIPDYFLNYTIIADLLIVSR